VSIGQSAKGLTRVRKARTRKGGDEVVGICHTCSLLNLFESCLGVSVLDVSANRGRKQSRLLTNVANAVAQMGNVDIFQIYTVELDTSALGIVEAFQHCHNSRFSRTTATGMNVLETRACFASAVQSM